MYARPPKSSSEANRALRFGVSGKLWRGALVMFDRETLSLWSQIDGRAYRGPSEGQTLTEVPSFLTDWASWRAEHPDTLVLVKPPLERSAYASYHQKAKWVGLPWQRDRDRRLSEKTLVLGVTRGDNAFAIPSESLPPRSWVATSVGGVELVVLHLAPGEYRTARGLDSGPRQGRLVEEQGRWWFAHEDRPMAVDSLEPGDPPRLVYWGIWARFHPETELLAAGRPD